MSHMEGFASWWVFTYGPDLLFVQRGYWYLIPTYLRLHPQYERFFTFPPLREARKAASTEQLLVESITLNYKSYINYAALQVQLLDSRVVYPLSQKQK